MTESRPSQIFVTEIFPSQSFCDGNCDGKLIIVTEIVAEGRSQFWKEELDTKEDIVTDRKNGICDRIATTRHKL